MSKIYVNVTDNATDESAQPVTGNQYSTNKVAMDVVQHGHKGSVQFHFDATISASTNYILFDLSDTTNYKHLNTNFFHLEWLHLEVDPSATADYEIQFGFIENIDGTDAEFYEIFHSSGSKTAGQIKDLNFQMYPSGPKLESGSVITSNYTAADTSFNTATLLKTLLDPSTADTYPGNNDFVMKVVITAGSIRLGVHGALHSH